VIDKRIDLEAAMPQILETTHGSVTVRPTRLEDAAMYRELRLEALRDHPVAFGMDYTEALTQPESHWEQRARDGAGTERSVLYVADAGARLVAMTGVFCEDRAKLRHSGMIWGVYVQPDWRGAGLSEALIEACVGWAQAKQLRILKLAVAVTNAPAIRRYLQCGFSVYGVEPEVIYHEGVFYDELLMARRL
jgi:GNAT superfamily N-acetyltransferase